MPVDPELFRSQGIEPLRMKIVVVKSPNCFREAYEPFAKAVFLVDQAHFFVVIWGVSSKLIPTHMSCGWLGAAPMACREGAGQVARASSTCFREQRTHLQRDALAWSSTVAGGAQASGRAESGAGREPLAAGRRNGGWPRAGTGTRAGSG